MDEKVTYELIDIIFVSIKANLNKAQNHLMMDNASAREAGCDMLKEASALITELAETLK